MHAASVQPEIKWIFIKPTYGCLSFQDLFVKSPSLLVSCPYQDYSLTIFHFTSGHRFSTFHFEYTQPALSAKPLVLTVCSALVELQHWLNSQGRKSSGGWVRKWGHRLLLRPSSVEFHEQIFLSLYAFGQLPIILRWSFLTVFFSRYKFAFAERICQAPYSIMLVASFWCFLKCLFMWFFYTKTHKILYKKHIILKIILNLFSKVLHFSSFNEDYN